MRRGRVKRPVSELQQELRDQVSLLMSYCTSFDGGDLLMVKPMATALRVARRTRRRRVRR